MGGRGTLEGQACSESTIESRKLEYDSPPTRRNSNKIPTFWSLLKYDIRYCTNLYYSVSILFYTILFDTIPHHTILYHIIPCYTLPYSNFLESTVIRVYWFSWTSKNCQKVQAQVGILLQGATSCPLQDARRTMKTQVLMHVPGPPKCPK